MIPKKIHYIWLGDNPHPNLMDICIFSWKEKLPEYEIIEWNEKNLNFQETIKNNKFLSECYERKLWAFLSDYFRIKVLYEQGGIYLDTDMQIVKKLDVFLKERFFIGAESKDIISAGIIGAEKGLDIVKEILNFYEDEIWKTPIYTIPDIITYIFQRKYKLELKEGINKIDEGIKVFPAQYFYPYHFTEEFKFQHVGESTYGIHWWGKSWGQKKDISKLYFLEFKHYRGLKKLLIDFLIATKLIECVKKSKLLKTLSKKI